MSAEQDATEDLPDSTSPPEEGSQEGNRPGDRGPDTVAVDLGDLETAAAIVATAVAVPFAQAAAQHAAADMYAKVRQLFARVLGREASELSSGIIPGTPALHVVGDSAANTWLEMRGDPTDEALSKLADTDLEALAARDPQGRAVLVYWDTDTREWRRNMDDS